MTIDRELLAVIAEHSVRMAEQRFRAEHNVHVSGVAREFGLATAFADVAAHFDGRLIAALEAAFAAPTPVQAVGWPIAVSGSDMIAIAETGSGKTLAYALPAMAHARKRRWVPTQCCDALVLAPTRELAAQIEQHIAAYGVHIELLSVCCYGGTDVQHDLERIADGVEILVATPGRLLLLLHRHAWLLRKATFVVLDEADRMLDLGFEPQIREAFSALPEHRQTLLFTATWPMHVQALAAEFLRPSPAIVRIGQADDQGALRAVGTVAQTVIVVPSDAAKPEKLRAALTSHGFGNGDCGGDGDRVRDARAIVFVNTKARCRELCAELCSAGFAADAIHGDRPQVEREAALAAFTSGRVRVLVATDVAARGIDVPGVRLVVNYDFPMAIGEQGIEDYVHRIGRSGRAGCKGAALTLFSAAADGKLARRLIAVLEGAGQPVPSELWALDSATAGSEGGEVLSARQKRKLPYGGRGGGGGRGRGRGRADGQGGRGRNG